MNLKVVNYTLSSVDSEDLEEDGILLCKRRQGAIAFDKCIDLRLSPNCNGCKYFDDDYLEIFKEESKEKRIGNTLKPFLTKEESSLLWDKMKESLENYDEDSEDDIL